MQQQALACRLLLNASSWMAAGTPYTRLEGWIGIGAARVNL